MFNQIQTLNNFFMKKIIYSLVTVLLMGGIFTSCIDNSEPDGIRDLRASQARYLDKLGAVEEANAAVSQAEAAYRQALAAVQQAIAAQEQAKAANLELLNQLLAAENEAAIAELRQEMAESELAHQAIMADLQAALAEAQKDLADRLAAIDIENCGLSDEEAAAIDAIRDNYVYYAQLLESYYEDVADELFFDLMDSYFDDEDEFYFAYEEEYLYDYYETVLDQLYLQLGYAEQEMAYWKSLLEDFSFDYLAEANEFKAAADAMASDFAELLRDSVLYVNTNKPILDAAIDAANEAYEEATKAPLDEFKAAVKNIKSNVVEPAGTPDGTGKATAKTFTYGIDAKFALPANGTGNLLGIYENFLGWDNWASEVSFVAGPVDTLKIKIENTTKDEYLKKVDSIYSGTQKSEKYIDISTGLYSAYKDFEREYLYDMGVAGIQADAEALRAAADAAQAEYDSILAILKSGKTADALLKAWYDAVKASAGAIEDALADVRGLVVPDPANEDKVYTYNGNGLTNYEGGRIINWKPSLFTAASDFTLTDASDYYFDATKFAPAPVPAIGMAPTKEDTVAAFNAVKALFDAVAALDPENVPSLKFIVSNDGGVTYEVASVKMNEISLDGLTLKAANAYLPSKGIKRSSTYDNKGILVEGGEPTGADYVSAITNIENVVMHFLGVAGYETLPYPYTAEDNALVLNTAGIAAYWTYVEDYYNYNYGEVGPQYYSDVYGIENPDFQYFSALSEEGQALYNWLEANKIYFGADGFGSIGHKVFFTKNTFTQPENVVLYLSVPDYNIDPGTGEAWIPYNGDIIDIFTSELGFIFETIYNNLDPYDYFSYYQTYTEPDHELEFYSLPLAVVTLDYLADLAEGQVKPSELWEALGKVLVEEVEPALNAVVANADAKAAKSAEDAAAYNEALATYRAAVKDAAKVRDDAIDEAQDAYDEGMKEITDAWLELKAEYDYYIKMYYGLIGAYAIHSDGLIGEEIADYLFDMYDAANDDCLYIVDQIAEIEEMLQGGVDPSDATLDIFEQYLIVSGIIDEMEQEKYEDLVFWYEYWKAAYEAAIEKVIK